MAGGAMVLVATVPTEFEAHVMAARLGAAGLLWQLQGNVGGPYPVGPVHVLVSADDAGVARELLLADEVEALFHEAGGDGRQVATEAAGKGARSWRRRRLAVGAAAVLGLVAVRVVADLLASGAPGPPVAPAPAAAADAGAVPGR